MRILVAQNVPGSRRGGMSRMMGFIHDRMEDSGDTVDYLVADDVPAKWKGRIERFSFPWLVYRKAVTAAREGRPYDVINVHEPSSAWIASRRSAAGNPRVVVTSHGVEQRGWEIALEERRLGRDGPGLKTRLAYPLTALSQCRVGLTRADHILCLSHQDREFLVDRFGVPRGRITPIAPAADPVYAEAFADRCYQHADRLLFFGTWLSRKGIDDLIAAFGKLATASPDLRLSVVGPGVPAEKVKGDFPAALRDRVDVYANLSEQELAKVLLDADIFVLPSLFEGTPQTLIEAMSTGMPVITTATSGMQDVVQDGVNGFLIPTRSPGAIVDAATRLMEDAALRKRIGQAGHLTATRDYRWDRLSDLVASIYRETTQ